MEEYARLFLEAGYDLPTVTRMTPEDLTAVGIKKPNHRKRLKAELANLNVPDNLPDYIPVSVWNFLFLLVFAFPGILRPATCFIWVKNGISRGTLTECNPRSVRTSSLLWWPRTEGHNGPAEKALAGGLYEWGVMWNRQRQRRILVETFAEQWNGIG